ncbi:multidrug efflux MFS transporter Cme [Clostridioides difficile]|uniref:multidrug efflux MFS transporter Cme n=1 Tax=Clostridioides difficile TaxID=1496 RepID=UPI00254E6FCF|nr:multidrug efflux MFS transporter Cme [Clostridioides difficile]MDL0375260.1 multidrug efflux MFS transporter Cme [Clostridioides difficile]
MENKNTNSTWKKKVILFLASQYISLFGSSLVQMAMIWYVTLQTSSGVWVTVLTVCSFIPQMIISFFAGVWADYYNRKVLIIVSDSTIAISTLVLILFMMSSNGTTSELIAISVISVIRSLGSGVQTPAVNAMIPQLVPEEHLMRFNGINSSLQSIVQFIVPIVAAAILGFGNKINQVLLIDVFTAIIAIVLLIFIKIPKHDIPKQTEKVSFFADMVSWIKYCFSDKFIRKVLFTYGAFMLLCVPSGFLIGLLIERTFGKGYIYLSIIEMIGFLGMVLGGLIIGVFGGFKNRNKTFFLAILSYAIFSIILGLVTQAWQFFIFMFFTNFSIPIIQASAMTMLQEHVAPQMLGRVLSLPIIIYTGFIPLGMMIFGPMADVISINNLIIIAGIILLFFALAIPYSKQFYKQGISKSNESE